jgi:hypothetical protein
LPESVSFIGTLAKNSCGISSVGLHEVRFTPETVATPWIAERNAGVSESSGRIFFCSRESCSRRVFSSTSFW